MNAPSTEVSPGIWAFFAFFLLAIALWLLMRNMFTRLRRMNLAERAEQERRAQERDRAEPAADDAGPTAVEPDAPAPSAALGDGAEEGQGRSGEV